MTVTKTPHEYIRVTYENTRVTYQYIWVTYENIRVTYEYIWVTYEHIQTHSVTLRLHTNKLVAYKCTGAKYDSRRVKNMKCTIFLFTCHFCIAQVMTIINTCKSAQVRHSCVCATYIGPPYEHIHAQTNLSSDVIVCDVAHQINVEYDDLTQVWARKF